MSYSGGLVGFVFGEDVPHCCEGGFGGFDAAAFLFGCELSAGVSCPDAVHVCGWEGEGVFEALFVDCAGVADFACLWDVGGVFVFFWEHEVGEVFACGFVLPCLFVCLHIGFVLVFCQFV